MNATDDTDEKAPTVRRASIQGQSNPAVSSVVSVVRRRPPLPRVARGIRHTWPRPGSAAAPRSCPKPSRKGPACFGHQRGAATNLGLCQECWPPRPALLAKGVFLLGELNHGWHGWAGRTNMNPARLGFPSVSSVATL